MSEKEDPAALQAEFDELAGRLVSLLGRAREAGFELRLVRVPGSTEEPAVPIVREPEPVAGPPPAVSARPEPECPRPPPSVPDWRGPLRALLPMLRTDRLGTEEQEDLAAFLDDAGRLRGFPRDVQVSLLEYVVARLRYLQERGMEDARVHALLASVTSYAERERCGFVHGPKRVSAPKSASWESDARACLNRLYDRALSEDDGEANVGRVLAVIEAAIRDAAPFEEVRPLVAAALRLGVGAANTRLVNLTAPFLGLMESFPELKALRSAIRTAERDARATPEADEPAISPDWPWLAFTRGKRVLMIGGDPREPNRERIERAFGFGELAWMKTEFSPRSIQAARERVTTGGADLVVILRRFVGHDTDDQIVPACAQTGTPWISVPSGYGIERIRQEIERRIPRPEPT